MSLNLSVSSPTEARKVSLNKELELFCKRYETIITQQYVNTHFVKLQYEYIPKEENKSMPSL